MYEITKDQKQQILNTLVEIPAKYSFSLITFFSQLPEKKQEEIENKADSEDFKTIA